MCNQTPCKFRDDELVTEVAWVVVYLSALSDVATGMLVKSDVLQLLVERLATSNSLQLLIPVRQNDQIAITMVERSFSYNIMAVMHIQVP